jgi:hypothetical protein
VFVTTFLVPGRSSAARAALDLPGAANVVANTSALNNPFKFETAPFKSAIKSNPKIAINH